MVWLKIIPGFLTLLIALLVLRWEVKNEKKKKGKLRATWLPLLYLLIAFAGAAIIWWDDRKGAEAAATAAKENGRLIAQLDRIEASGGSLDAARRYIESERAQSRPYAQETTREAASRYFASEGDRKKALQNVADLNEQFAIAQRNRLQPLTDLVVEKIEAWVGEMKARGIKVSAVMKQLTAVSEKALGIENVIPITFESGHRLEVQLISANAEQSRLARRFHIQIPYYPPHESLYEVWNLSADERTVWLRNPRAPRLAFKPASSDAAVPVQDPNFREAISQSLDEVFQFLLEEIRLKR